MNDILHFRVLVPRGAAEQVDPYTRATNDDAVAMDERAANGY